MLQIDNRLAEPLAASAVSIGNFDGVHHGHRRLVKRLLERATALQVSSVIVTFQPHPLEVLKPELAPKPITLLPEKARRLEQLGIDVLLVLRFDLELAVMAAVPFLQEIIVEQLHPKLLIVGHDFNFGRNREGNIELLQAFCREAGIELEIIDAVRREGVRVSSTHLRGLLSRGAVEEAARLMGHPYSVEGVVVQGEQRGRQLGFPTANLRVTPLLIPRGVYRGVAHWEGGCGAAAINVGTRPTFGAGELLIEVHVLDKTLQLYGQELRIELMERLRPEVRFDGPEALKAQVELDIARVREAAGKLPNAGAGLAPGGRSRQPLMERSVES